MRFYDDVRRLKLREIEALRGERADFVRRCTASPLPRSLRAALSAADPAVIAEVKRASPSKGTFAPGLDAPAQARKYVLGGAAACSVLTESVYFGGSLADLAAVKAAVPVPVLRKDFVLDELQVLEARASGADAVLLIVGFLEGDLLGRLLRAVEQTGMEALVEVHEEEELQRALEAGAGLIGINNRDLRALQVDLRISERLIPLVPGGCQVVVESGIHGPEDVRRLRICGARAFLVGEHLVRSVDPEAAVRELLRG